MDLMIEGKVALVTGGAKGIGAGVSEALAQEGCRVAAVYRSDPEGSEAACRAMDERSRGEVVPFRFDVTDPDGPDGAFDAVREALGPVDILVNNACGGCELKPFEQMAMADWRRGMAGALDHVFAMSNRFVRDCRAEGRPGRIVSFSAKAAFYQNGRDKRHYVAAKGAIASLTRAIAKEETEHGIIANAVVPGYVISDSHYHPGDADYEAKLGLLPTHRFAEPIEIGRLVAFLCSPMCTQVIGATIDCSGGTMI